MTALPVSYSRVHLLGWLRVTRSIRILEPGLDLQSSTIDYQLLVHDLQASDSVNCANLPIIKTSMPLSRTYARSDIEGLITAGDIIVVHQGHVLRLNHWLDKHPGGRLVIQHMVGRDATDEISV